MKPDKLGCLEVDWKRGKISGDAPQNVPAHHLLQQLPALLFHCILPHSATLTCTPILFSVCPLRANETEIQRDAAHQCCCYHFGTRREIRCCCDPVPVTHQREQDWSTTSSFPVSSLAATVLASAISRLCTCGPLFQAMLAIL